MHQFYHQKQSSHANFSFASDVVTKDAVKESELLLALGLIITVMTQASGSWCSAKYP